MLCFRSETVQDVFLWGGVGQVRPRILHVGKYLAGTALAGHQTELQQLFDELSIRYNLKANTRFNYTKFASVYHEVSGFADVPISDALKILYEAGLMCVHADSGTYFYFRENPIRYDYDKWKNYSFELHVGLWKLFHIW